MRALLLAIIFSCGLALSAADANDHSKPGDAIEKTIADQIAAFRRDDAETAFSFASPSIRRQFGSASIFMSMVVRGYPQIYRPQSFHFAQRETRGKHTIQQVIVTGQNGERVAAYYDMIQVDGRWRINGCQLARLPGESI